MEILGLINFYRPPSKEGQDTICTGNPPGVAFGVFQKTVVSWARNEYGERFGKELKQMGAFDIDRLDFEDDVDLDKFEEYSHKVYEAMTSDSFKRAESSVGTLKEKARSFQKDLNNKYREWTFCLLHKMVYDKARRENKPNIGESVLDTSQAFFVKVSAVHPEAEARGERMERLPSLNSSRNKFPMLTATLMSVLAS